MAFIERTLGINSAYNTNLYAKAPRADYQPKFVQKAVSSPFNLSHPRVADFENIKASPAANVLDYLA